MKAIVFEKYGSPDVLELREILKPEPKPDEVLVRIHATALNAADWHLMRASPFVVRLMFGLLRPRHNVLGADVAGTVEVVGSEVKQFKAGDEVFGDLSGAGFGGLAEYVTAPENMLATKPKNLSFEETAALPMAAGTALQALRNKGNIKTGQQVLINGASGGVGTFAVQIAKAFGAEVTAVCSTGKTELVRELGADHVIDYTKEDFTKSGKRYDLILAANGYHPISHYKRALTGQGRYVMVGGGNKQMFQAMTLGPLMSEKGGKQFGNLLAEPNQEDLKFVKELVETGKVKPVIDRRYLLAETREAFRYLEAGHARGKIVITTDLSK